MCNGLYLHVLVWALNRAGYSLNLELKGLLTLSVVFGEVVCTIIVTLFFIHFHGYYHFIYTSV